MCIYEEVKEGAFVWFILMNVLPFFPFYLVKQLEFPFFEKCWPMGPVKIITGCSVFAIISLKSTL